MHKGLKKLGITVPPEDMASLFNAFDTDSNFRLEPLEFYELYRKHSAAPALIAPAAKEQVEVEVEVRVPPPSIPPRVQEQFDALDTNQDGALSVLEVHAGLKALGIEKSAEEVLTIFNNFDTDRDCLLGPKEFGDLYIFVSAYAEAAAPAV